MALPARIPKRAKRESRWKSPAHRAWVRSFACSNCGSQTNAECAHVRLGSGAGLGQKPDDWRCVSLCGGPEGCHTRQHNQGEETFWKGRDIAALIDEFCAKSPKAREIREARNASD